MCYETHLPLTDLCDYAFVAGEASATDKDGVFSCSIYWDKLGLPATLQHKCQSVKVGPFSRWHNEDFLRDFVSFCTCENRALVQTGPTG